jgi:hypothetical protein
VAGVRGWSCPAAAADTAITLPGVVVTRRLDADGTMIWARPDRGGPRAKLKRIGGPSDGYTRPGPNR